MESLSQSLRLVAGRKGPTSGVWKQGQRLSLHMVPISGCSSGSLALNSPPLPWKPLQARAEAGFKEAAWSRQRPAHLIFIRPLSTSGLLPAARAPSQNPSGTQNPRIVLLSDSVSRGRGGIWWGVQRAWCSADIIGPCSHLSTFGSLPTLSYSLQGRMQIVDI